MSLTRILDRLKKINKLIRDLSSGDADLTVRLDVKNVDEIGELVIGVNMFLEKFHQIMSNIKQSEIELNEAGTILSSEIENTTTTISQMSGNINLVNSQVANQATVVGNSTELKNVILFDNVQVPHYNYVGDSILGYKAHMGAGSITSNVKSDKLLVVIKNEGELLETNRKKVGAMLGDNVEVGCNSVLNPGTVIGKHSNIYQHIHSLNILQ